MDANYVFEKHAWNIGNFKNSYQNELNQISEIYILRYRFDHAIFCFIMTYKVFKFQNLQKSKLEVNND